MFKTPHTRSSRLSSSVSTTLSIVTMTLAIFVTPQIVLRALAVGKADAALFVSLGVGLVAFTITLLVLNGVNYLAPRKSAHQLIARYIGPWAGVLVGAARFLIHGVLVLLGVELVLTALNTVVELDQWDSLVAMVLVLALAIPTIFAGVGRTLRWPRYFAYMAIAVLITVLIWGLVKEFSGDIQYSELIRARHDANLSGIVAPGRYPLAESILGGCFPAAVIFAMSEHVLAKPEHRRLSTRRLLYMSVPALLLIAVTMYFMVQLELPGRRLGLPALSIAYALFGQYGRLALAVLVALAGVSVAVSAYRQLPRLLRELAIDGILPRRLAAQDSVIPRRVIVVIVAVLVAAIALFFNSTRSLAMIFMVITFFVGLLLCFAFVARSRSILNDSVRKEERSRARIAAWGFRLYGLCIAILMLIIMVVQPLWIVSACVSLAVPAVFLYIHRRGSGKISDALTDADTGLGALAVTKVHSFVLVDRVDLPTLKALAWARANRNATLQALCVDTDSARTSSIRQAWQARKIPIELTIVGTPSGAVRGPIIEYIRAFRSMHPNDVVMVYMPKVISTGSWERFFIRHTTPSIVSELELEPGVMVTRVPYRIESSEHEE